MRMFRWVVAAILLRASCHASLEQQVRAHLQAKEIAAPETVVLLDSSEPSRKYDLVLGTAIQRDRNVWLRARCRRSADCKPFFARLHYSTAESAEVATRQLSANSERKLAPILIRAGSHVRLSIKSRRVVLSLNAIALQNGRKGERIRTKCDGKIHYATVVSSTELEELL